MNKKKKVTVTKWVVTPKPNSKYFDVREVTYKRDQTPAEANWEQFQKKEKERTKKREKEKKKALKKANSSPKQIPTSLAVLILIMYFLYIIKTFYPQIWECFETLIETGSFI